MSPEDRPETDYMSVIILWIMAPILYLNEEWNDFLSPPRQQEMRRHVIALRPFLKGPCVTFLLFTIITNVATAAVVSVLVLIISLLVGILEQLRQLNRELPETRNDIRNARQDILNVRQNILDTNNDLLTLSGEFHSVRLKVLPPTGSGKKKPTRAQSPRR